MKTKPIILKRSPSYTSILKLIAKAKTVNQITKVGNLVSDYDGSYRKFMNVIRMYNDKNHKLRYGK